MQNLKKAFVFLLDYNKYKHTKEKNLENKFKTYSKLDNISDVLSEETKTIPEAYVLYILLRFFSKYWSAADFFYCMLMWHPSILSGGDVTHLSRQLETVLWLWVRQVPFSIMLNNLSLLYYFVS